MKKGGFSLFLAFTTQGPLGVRVKEMGEMGKGGKGEAVIKRNYNWVLLLQLLLEKPIFRKEITEMDEYGGNKSQGKENYIK